MHQNLFENLKTSCERFGPAIHLVEVTEQGRRETSFGQLWDLVCRGAGFIQRRRPAEGPFHVGILAENSPAWVVAYYAITGAGATAVPLDARATEEEILAVIRAASVGLLLVSPTFTGFAMRAAAAGEVPAWQELGDSWLELLATETAIKASEADPRSIASIIYTSGTTGNPKGVMLTHGNILNQSWQNIPAIGTREGSRLLAILPLNHIFVFVGLISCLECGAAVVFLQSLKPARIVATLKDEQITHLAGIPLLYDAFLKGILLKVRAKGWPIRLIFQLLRWAGAGLYRLGGTPMSAKLFHSVHAEFAPRIERFICGGAKANPKTVRAFLAMGYEFQEGYGLTETAGGIIINPADRSKHVGSVGRPFGDTEVRLDQTGAAGEGEICIRGQSVFAGYYRNQAATDAVMDAEGWFHTGDLGRLDPSGCLSITGRARELIVLASGKKFSPEELEGCFARSPLLAEVAAVGVGPAGAEQLHLVAVPAEDLARKHPAPEVEASIRREVERIAQGLPSYKRPQGLAVRWTGLPRTTSRKIRRGELKTWLEERQDWQQAGLAAQAIPQSLVDRELMASPEMAAVLRCCSAVLGKPLDPDGLRPGTHLYLDLGMDSIKILEATGRMETELRIKFRADGFSWAQNLGDLAEAVRTAEDLSAQEVTGWRAAIRSAAAEIQNASLSPGIRRLAAVLEPLDYGLIRFIGKVFYRLRSHNIEALPPSGPYILAPNHVSYFDYPAVAGTLPSAIRRQAYLIGKKEVYGNLLGRVLSSIHRVIPVDRAGDAMQALLSAAGVLKSGKILYLHPEGTRSPTGRLQTFKQGVAILSCELGVPVVPVYIKGTYDVYPKGTKMPRMFQFSRFRRYCVEVFYGEPIDPAALPPETTYQAMLDQLHQAMEAMERKLTGIPALANADQS